MVKIFMVLIPLFLFVNLSYAQKLKKKTETHGPFREVYFIDRKSNFRNGESITINTQTKDTLSLGKYLNGRRVGEWTFYKNESDEKYIIYDFSADSLIYLNHELAADTFLVKTDNGFEVQQVDRPALYLGYYDELLVNLPNDVLTVEHMKKNLEGMLVINYRIDTIGNLSAAKVVMELDRSIAQNVDRTLRKLPGKFLPALKNGNPVESAFYVRLNIVKLNHLNEIIEALPKASYIFDVDLKYGVEVRERVIMGPHPSRKSMIGY